MVGSQTGDKVIKETLCFLIYLFFYSFLIHRLIELRIGADLTCHLEKLLSHHPMFENVESLLLQTFPQLLTRLATLQTLFSRKLTVSCVSLE